MYLKTEVRTSLILSLILISILISFDQILYFDGNIVRVHKFTLHGLKTEPNISHQAIAQYLMLWGTLKTFSPDRFFLLNLTIGSRFNNKKKHDKRVKISHVHNMKDYIFDLIVKRRLYTHLSKKSYCFLYACIFDELIGLCPHFTFDQRPIEYCLGS